MNQQFRAKIDKVTDNNRPEWSVMIPVYNCAKYLRRTLESVLAQDLGKEKMQIEVIDDFSSDNPEQVVWEMGKGRVDYFRQDKNVGHTRNFKTCLERSRGRLIHQLHGDDFVLLDFYKEMEELFQDNPTIGAGFCQNILVNEQEQVLHSTRLVQTNKGIIPNYLDVIGKQQDIFTPSIVVKREVYEQLGGFDERLSWCEDWEMWARIAAQYDFGFIPKILAAYRVHGSSNTAKYSKDAEKIKDLQRGIEIINQYLPIEKKALYKKFSLNYYAETWAMTEAVQALEQKDVKVARLYLREIKKMATAPTVKMRMWKLYFQTLRQ